MSGSARRNGSVRPRVLRIITRLNVGGPSTHVLIADAGLRERGWETLLVHGALEPDEVGISLDGVDLPLRYLPTLVRPISPIADLRATASLVRIIRDYRPHIIHTHLSKAGLLGRSAAIFSSRAARIHTFHGTVFRGYFGASKSGMVQRAERILGARTDRVLALSERQRDELLAYRIAPAALIEIVPLGLELDRFRGGDRRAARAALGIAPRTVAVMALCRLVPVKRIDRMLRAMAVALATAPALRLYVVGDGAERAARTRDGDSAARARDVGDGAERAALERQAADLGIADRVTFAGWSTDAPAWYAAADIVALSSDSEGTPLSLIEAATAGRAAVATDVGGVADVVVDGVTGIVVPCEDEAALAEALARLGNDASLRARLGAAAPERAVRYAAERLVDDLDSLYRHLLAERGVKL